MVRWGHLLADFLVFGGPAAVLFGSLPSLAALTQIVNRGSHRGEGRVGEGVFTAPYCGRWVESSNARVVDCSGQALCWCLQLFVEGGLSLSFSSLLG